MDRQTYQRISRQLDFRRYPSVWVRHLLVDLCLGASIVTLWQEGSTLAYVTSQLLLPVLFFRNFSLMHEAVHHTVSDRRNINDAIGVLTGLLCFMPYESWRRLHLEHHLWAGNITQDPSSKLRRDYDPTRRGKYRFLNAVWQSWIPLMGLLQLFVFWLYPIQQLRRENYGRRTKALIVVSLVLPIAAYTVALFCWPNIFQVAHWAPGLILYLIALEVVNFPHHMDVYAFEGQGKVPIAEQWLVTRSSKYPRWVARTFFLNFNLHTEHHLFPNLPWTELDRASPLVKAALGDRYNESLGNAWILKNRKRDLRELLPLAPDPAVTRRAS